MGFLGLREQPYDFHVIGLWEHIDEGQLAKAISSVRKEAKIPSEDGGLTGDIDDPFGFQSGHLIHGSLASSPRRVEDDKIRLLPFPFL